MQRRNFISNLAVILPAGAVAPNLLFEDSKQYKNLVKIKILVLGAGEAGLFIASKFKRQKLETVIVEPSGGVSKAAAYNHSAPAGVLKQYHRDEKAEVRTITASHYDGTTEEVKTGYTPIEINKTPEGFVVTDGEYSFLAEKLVIALPFEIDTEKAAINIQSATGRTVTLSCKRKGQKNPAVIRTISAVKIDEEIVTKFAGASSAGILAVV